MGDVMKEASFSLTEAYFAAGDFSVVILENVDKAWTKVRTKNDNVAGNSKLKSIPSSYGDLSCFISS